MPMIAVNHGHYKKTYKYEILLPYHHNFPCRMVANLEHVGAVSGDINTIVFGTANQTSRHIKKVNFRIVDTFYLDTTIENSHMDILQIINITYCRAILCNAGKKLPIVGQLITICCPTRDNNVCIPGDSLKIIRAALWGNFSF